MLTAELFTVVKGWDNLSVLLVHTHSGILFSLKREGGPVTRSNMDSLEDIMLNEVSKPVTKRQILEDSTFMR